MNIGRNERIARIALTEIVNLSAAQLPGGTTDCLASGSAYGTLLLKKAREIAADALERMNEE